MSRGCHRTEDTKDAGDTNSMLHLSGHYTNILDTGYFFAAEPADLIRQENHLNFIKMHYLSHFSFHV